jgi:hypothetical protein
VACLSVLITEDEFDIVDLRLTATPYF